MLGAKVRSLRQTLGEDHSLTRKTAEILSTVLHFQGDVDERHVFYSGEEDEENSQWVRRRQHGGASVILTAHYEKSLHGHL